MRTGIVVLVIAIAMMATVQSVAADPVGAFVAQGTVQYESGETCPYSWNLEMENLDQDLEGEPWLETTASTFPSYDYFIAGATVADSDRIKVTVTSPDGSYSGTNTMVASEAWNGVNVIINIVVYEVPQEPETFTKSLPDGWNLISLPFEATDNSTGAVLSTVTYNAVKQYNAVTKQFEDATTMDRGTGYFVHVTTAGTWEYAGTPESSTTTQLKSGLNMIGVPNCGMSVSAAMGSTDYRYAAKWNATSQSYEVYNPNAPAAFHDFTTIEPGEGYFVSVLSDGALTVSCP